MTRAEIERLPGIAGLTEGADHVDVHAADGYGSIRSVAANFLTYRPAWLGWLWRVRPHLLRLLGRPGHAVPAPTTLTEADLPSRPGDKAGFFTVVRTDNETHWIVEGRESHLEAWLAVVATPLDGQRFRFHAVTGVRYLNAAGRIYFNLIRPFHHLVVRSALRAAVAGQGTGGRG